MKLIFHISRSFYPQIGQLQLMEVTRHLARAGYAVNAICSGRDNEKQREMLEGVDIHRITYGKGGILNARGFCRQAIKEIKLVMLRHSVTEAIAHVYFSQSTAFLPAFAKFDRFLNGRIKWFLDVRSGPVRPGIAASKFNLVYKLSYEFYDGIFFIDELLRNKFKKKKRPEIILPLGSNFSIFKPSEERRKKTRAELGILDQDFVLVYIGELSKFRRLRVLIDSFRVFQSRNFDTNIKMLFVGDGDDKGGLINCVDRYGLAGRVLFTGYVPYEQIPSILNASDVGLAFVPITRYYDVQPPRKTVDYLASGLPVIATNTAGNRRFVKNGINGLVVEDVPEAISEAVSKLMLDTRFYGLIKDEARKSVMDYDFQTIVKTTLIPAYENAIS